jgi:hypothetical protein
MAPPTLDQQIAQAMLLQDEADRERELIRLLQQKQTQFVQARTNELIQSAPFTGTPEEAKAIAQDEFTSDYLMPLQSTFGTLPEKVFDFSLAATPFEMAGFEEPAPPMQLPPRPEDGAPDLFTALRPQVYLPDYSAESERSRVAAESTIDFAKLEEAFREQEGMDEAQAKLQREAIQRAYDAVRRNNPTRPPDVIFKEVLGELEALGSTLQGEGAMLQDEQAARVGPADPLYQAFVRQRQQGAAVPDLTPAQIAYFDVIYKDQQRQFREETAEELTGQTERYYRLPDGTDVLADAYDIQRQQTTELPDPVSEFQKPIEREQAEVRARTMQAGAVPDLWWADPEKKPKVLADPEAYTQLGIFSSTTPFGGTIETPAGWFLRSAMSPLNIGASAMFEGTTTLFEGAFTEEGEKTLQELRQESREEKTPLYADSPILLNVAENRGFTMEMNESADLMEMSPTGKVLMTAGGFMLDLLDPSLGMAGGAAKGLRTTGQLYKARRAIYGGEKALSSLMTAGKTGAGVGARYFLDDLNFVSILTPNRFKTNLPVGDVRSVMAADLAGSLGAREIARAEASAEKALARIAEEGLENTSYGKALREALEGAAPENYGKIVDELDSLLTPRTTGATGAADELIGRAGTPLDEMTRVVDDFDGQMRSLDEMGTGAKGLGKINADDLAHNLGALAKRDEAVDALLRQVDEAAGTGPKLARYVEAIYNSPDAATLVPRLKNQFAFDRALAYVYENTKGLTGFDDLRAITRNTWARKEQAAKILEHTRDKTEIGKIAREMVENDVEIVMAQTKPQIATPARETGSRGMTGTQAAEGRFVPHYNLKNQPELIERLKAVARKLNDYGKLSNKQLSDIVRGLDYRGGLISTGDFRALMEGTTDLVAEGLSAGSRSPLMRGKDVGRLPATEANLILEPLEMRSFGAGALKRWTIETLQGGGKVEGRAITPQQRSLVREAQQEASNLDTKLRQTAKGIKTSPDYAARYGVPQMADASNSQVVGVAIVGEKQGAGFDSPFIADLGVFRQLAVVEEGIAWTIRRLFYVEKKSESLLDAVLGSKLVFEEQFLSSQGQKLLDEVITEAAEAAIRNPELYWDSVKKVIDKMELLIKNPENLKPRVNPKNIQQVMKKTGGRIPAEVQVGNYFYNETTRIMDRKITELIDGDPMVDRFVYSPPSTTAAVKPDNLGDFVKNYGFDGDTQAFYRELVKERAVNQVAGRNAGDELSIFEDVLKVLKKKAPSRGAIEIVEEVPDYIKANIQQLEDNINILRATIQTGDPIAIAGARRRIMQSPLVKEAIDGFVKADEAASVLVRRNGLDDYGFHGNYKATRNLLDDLVGSGNENYIAAVIGRDAYDELDAAVKAGKGNSFSGYVDAALRSATGKKDLKRLWNSLTYVMREINNARYNFLLSARPRFSAANLSTAPYIVYSTIGEVIGPTALHGGQQIVRKGWDATDPRGLQVGAVAPDGRTYTNLEIMEALRNAGIRSEFGFITDVATQQRIINFVEDRGVLQRFANSLGFRFGVEEGTKTLAARFVEGAGQFSQDIVLKQDLMFRAAVMKKALEEGRSMQEATNLARRSLFDYNELTNFEKALSGYAFIFYAFNRQNFATLLRAMADPTKMKRYINVLKTDRGISAVAQTASGTQQDPEVFYPDYTLSRQLLRGQTSGDRDIWIAGPPVPPIDGMIFMATLMKRGGAQELIKKQLHPNVAAALGTETMPKSFKQVAPEHIAYASFVNDSPNEIAGFLSTILGGEIRPVPSTDETAVGGYIYPLSPEQQAAYKAFDKWVLGFTGIGAPANDYIRYGLGFSAVEGTPQTQMTTFERVLGTGLPTTALTFVPYVGAVAPYTTPMMTPIKATRPETQRAYEIYSRIDAINARLKQMGEEEKKER